MSYPLEPKLTYATKLIPIWYLLAALGGFVNAFAFVACGRYVSHVTGIGTMFGVSFGQRDVWVGLEMLAIIVVFISGSFTAACATTVAAHHGKRPRLRTAIFLIALLLAAVGTAGHAGWFGPMDDEFSRPRDLFLLLALSFICGMQNGTFSLLTQGQIRTTHLTGLSTDLGADLAHLLFAPRRASPVSVRRIGTTRLLLLAGFATGAVLAVILGGELGYVALYAPALLALIVGVGLEARIAEVRDRARELPPETTPRAGKDPGRPSHFVDGP